MPRTKSAKKAFRQNLRRHERNLARKDKTQTVLKRFRRLVTEKKFKEAREQLPLVYKALDKMEKVNLIKPGKADRLKSKFSKRLRNQ